MSLSVIERRRQIHEQRIFNIHLGNILCIKIVTFLINFYNFDILIFFLHLIIRGSYFFTFNVQMDLLTIFKKDFFNKMY